MRRKIEIKLEAEAFRTTLMGHIGENKVEIGEAY